LARTVCVEHCLDVNHVSITVCEELNDDDDGDDDADEVCSYSRVMFRSCLTAASVEGPDQVQYVEDDLADTSTV